MTNIKANSWGMGANIGAGADTPNINTTFRDVADDLAGIQPTAISSQDATDLASAITLVNEIKAALNALEQYTLKTVKG